MSRRSLRPRADTTGLFEVAIGWDRPLQTYFVIVFGPPTEGDEDPEVILWRGTAPHEISIAGDAVSIAADYADIPDGLAATLEIDRMSGSATPDGPMQHWARKWIGDQGIG